MAPENQPQNSDEMTRKLLHPLEPGSVAHGNWTLATVEVVSTTPPKLLILLKEAGAERQIRIEASPRDPAVRCYETSESFNLAFAAEKMTTLPLDDEKAVVAVFDAIHQNDHGRFRFESDPNGTARLVEAETPPRVGILARLRKRFFGK